MVVPRPLIFVSLLLAFMALGTAAQSSEGPSGLKRTVAVARFSNETRSGQSFFLDSSGDRLGKQAADILSARLAATNRFLLFERLDADEVSAEKSLAGLQASGVGVDYLIVGSVSEFGRSNESDTGLFSRAKTQRAYAKVNVRLIEVATGRVVDAYEGEGEATTETKRTFGVGSSAGFDQTLTDQAISAAIFELVSGLVENMTSAPWRSYLLGKEGELWIIAGGPAQGLQPGMRLGLYREGAEVRNPQTGATIQLPGRRVGTLRVESSFGEDEFSEVSFTTLEEGAIEEEPDAYYIAES